MSQVLMASLAFLAKTDPLVKLEETVKMASLAKWVNPVRPVEMVLKDQEVLLENVEKSVPLVFQGNRFLDQLVKREKRDPLVYPVNKAVEDRKVNLSLLI